MDDVVFLENMGRLMKIGKWECFHPLIYGKYWKFGGLVTRAPIYIYKTVKLGMVYDIVLPTHAKFDVENILKPKLSDENMAIHRGKCAIVGESHTLRWGYNCQTLSWLGHR